jgi:hypothetical protein
MARGEAAAGSGSGAERELATAADTGREGSAATGGSPALTETSVAGTMAQGPSVGPGAVTGDELEAISLAGSAPRARVASVAEFARTLEERIEKRRQVYRTLIEHDPDRDVLRAWGVEGS